MKRILELISLLGLIILLASCQSDTTPLETIGLDGLSGKEILLGLEDGSISSSGYAVSVYDDELVVILEDDRINVDMPEDEFYVSVAPYITQTHECVYHSATGCRGELKNETFFIEFVTNDGTVILSEERSTQSNGFIDLWLPRDIEGTLTITQNDLSAEKILSTTSGNPTCETTMQLT
jgi:hypothetical protein